MSKRKRELTSEEKRLWRRVAEGVNARKPLPPEPEPEVAPAPVAKKARAAPRPVSSIPRKPTPAKQVPLADRGGEKRVRRGRLDIDSSLDLHGHTLSTAQNAVSRFLMLAHARGDRTVIVVTGVGRGGEGVLKRALPDWLAARELRTLIAGYAQAHRSHGGVGAFYVFLKRPDTAD